MKREQPTTYRAVKGTGRYIVSLYLEDIAYGGPEEGGWYYDCGSLVRPIRRFRSHKVAMAYTIRLNRKLRSRTWGPNEGRRDKYSVLSEGEYTAAVFRDTAPDHFPAYQPRYE